MSDFAYPLHEECGVFGIYDRAGTEDVAAAAYSALYALQHRGQESCGIAVNDDGVINGHRDLGLVNEVFTPAVLASISKPTAHMATTASGNMRAISFLFVNRLCFIFFFLHLFSIFIFLTKIYLFTFYKHDVLLSI